MTNAKSKKQENIELETKDEIEEVRETEPEIDLPDEAPELNLEEDKEPDKTAKAGKRSAKSVREAEAEEARQQAKLERTEKDEKAEAAPPRPKRQLPNPLHQHGKKYRKSQELIESGRLYPLEEALALAKKSSTTKFDSSVELHVNLGVDPRQADQMVRATVVLPKGTGKTTRIAVFADGKAATDAQAAGADIVGTDKLMADIEKGKLDFDILIATPDKMGVLGKVAKVLGPRGLMPNPKSGTVTPDTAKAVLESKAGRVEFRIDKQAIIHQTVGKASFGESDLLENTTALVQAILKAKPSAAKGTYIKAMAVATTMGPGIKIDAPAAVSQISGKRT
jgi:large subunit ribosomal protein L1